MELKNRAFAFALLFESGLGIAGVGFAYLSDNSQLDAMLQITSSAVLRGLLAVFPMLAMLGVLTRSVWPPFVEIRLAVEQLVYQMFFRSSWLELALISLAAGVGEEILFRGALQPWIASWTTPWIALAVVSLLFGLAHALSMSYFVLATLIGGYLGWLAMEFGDLVAPIVAHATYDCAALIYFQWKVKQR